MTAFLRLLISASQVLLPLVLLGGLSMVVAAQLGLRLPAPEAASLAPTTTTIAPRAYAYRAVGAFLSDGNPVDGPLVAVEAPPALEIMTYQVTISDYGHCVAAGACKPASPRRRAAGNVPVTGVSFNDAESYARWLSDLTGETWRLPTIAEWTFAAGSKAADQALGIETVADPAARWLAEYERESVLGSAAFAEPGPVGSLGVNEFGVADLAGSVWEWTASCDSRTTLDGSGQHVSTLQSCGARFLEGRHRTAMTAFVRDARGGGCSVGAPPDNLGFRLVKEPTWYGKLLTSLRWA